MKKIKKFLSIILTVVMVLAMAAPAAAATTDGTIEISNVKKGETYNIYRIFDLNYATAGGDGTEDDAYAYTVNSKWQSFINQSTIKGVYVNVDLQGYVTWIGGDTEAEKTAAAAAFAKLARDYATENNIVHDGTNKVAADFQGTEITFDNLPLGYYLVDTTVGTLCSLDTTNTTANITEKNEAPTIKKKVEENSTGAYGESNDAYFTDTVKFQATITAKEGAKKYVMHDNMVDGLTYVKVTEVKLTSGNATTTVDASNYTVTENPNTTKCDDCDFDVEFEQSFLDTLKDDDTIVVSYEAILNGGATVNGTGNENSVKLSYGDAQNTTESITTTYVHEVNIFKYTGDDVALKDAEFILYKATSSNVPTTEYAKVSNGKLTGWTPNRVEAEASSLKSGVDGFIKIAGIDSGNYILEEIKAPDGYNKLGSTIAVIINKDGTVTNSTTHNNVAHTIKVENNTGTELPSTGGIGTTIFYLAGIILMAGAVFFVIRSKRREN